MFQILLDTLSNLLDSANLIKLVWPCIIDDSCLFDWFDLLSIVDGAIHLTLKHIPSIFEYKFEHLNIIWTFEYNSKFK